MGQNFKLMEMLPGTIIVIRKLEELIFCIVSEHGKKVLSFYHETHINKWTQRKTKILTTCIRLDIAAAGKTSCAQKTDNDDVYVCITFDLCLQSEKEFFGLLAPTSGTVCYFM